MRINELCSSEPRYYLAMDFSDGTCVVGANCNYTLDTPLKEALLDFLKYCREEHKQYCLPRGKLQMVLCDVEIKDKRLYLPADV